MATKLVADILVEALKRTSIISVGSVCLDSLNLFAESLRKQTIKMGIHREEATAFIYG